MSSEQFCLRWKNFEFNIAAYLNSLRNCDEFVDVTITCGDQNFKAHKLILSACSPYFHQIFQDNPCKHPVIILKNVPATDMESILLYIYTGEAVVCQENISSFFSTAQLLQVIGLTYENLKTKRVYEETKNGLDKVLKSNTSLQSEEITIRRETDVENLSSIENLKSSVSKIFNPSFLKEQNIDVNKNNTKSNILKNHLNKSCLKNKSSDESLNGAVNKSASEENQICLNASNCDVQEKSNDDLTKKSILCTHNDNENETNVSVILNNRDCETVQADNNCIEKADFEERCPILSQQLLLPKKRKLSTADYNKNVEIFSDSLQDSSKLNKQLKLNDEESNWIDKISDDNSYDVPVNRNSPETENIHEDHDSKLSASEILRNRLSEVIENESGSGTSCDNNLYKADIFIKKEPYETETDESVGESFLEPEISVKEEFPSENENGKVEQVTWNSFDDSSMNEDLQAVNSNNKTSEQKGVVYDTILKVPNPDVSFFSKTVQNDNESSHLTLTPNVEIFLKNTNSISSNLLGNLGKTNFFQKNGKPTKVKKSVIKKLSQLPNLDVTDNCNSVLLLPSTSKDELTLIHLNKNSVLKNAQRGDVVDPVYQKSELQKSLLKSDSNKNIVKSDLTQKNLHNILNLTNFPCPHCKQPYNNLSALKYHVRLMHSDLENKLFCYLCPMSFIEREFFKAHLWETHSARF